MQKIITTRFATTCKQCKQGIAAGERVYWLGRGSGIRHLHCGTNEPETTPKTDKKPSNFSHTIKFTDLREQWKKLSTGDFSGLKRAKNKSVAEFLYRMWETDAQWIGATIPETTEWLDRGYVVEGLTGIDSSLFPAKPRRRIKYSEEGDEMLIDLAWSGVDEHFIEHDKRMTKPGLKVDIELCFDANFGAKIIADYQRWIARMLQSIEEAAIDVEVDITNRASAVYEGTSYSQIAESRVRVKESGEASDFASWSAMFSPGGFRQLSFAAIVFSAEFHGLDAKRSLGSAEYAKDWVCAYDVETNTLSIANPGSSREFPEFEMTEKFRAILESISG